MKSAPDTTFWSRHATRILVGLMCIVIVLCVIVVIKVRGLDAQPAWWVHGVEDAKYATGIENTITTQLTAPRREDEQEWWVALSPLEINTWMAHRLAPTVRTHFGDDAWPIEIETARVSIKEDTLMVGVLVRHNSGGSYVWAECTLGIHSDAIRVTINDARVGRTRIPTRALRSFLHGSTTYEMRPYLDLGDGRVARILAIRINNGRIELKMETTPDARD